MPLSNSILMFRRQFCKLPFGVISKEELLIEGLQPELMPKHVAIIPDGNRRWAKERGLSPEKGHEAGKKVLGDLCRYCSKWGVKVLSAYAFSTENWSRPKAEVTFLMTSYFEGLIHDFMRDIARCTYSNVCRYGMKMSVIGDKSNLPNSLKEAINHAEETTKDNTGLHFVAALNYGGRYDIIQATKKIAAKVKDGVIQLEDINDKLIDTELETKYLEYPNPDLLIRTSGELRISNYMLWQLAYSEFCFVDKFFPELDEADFVAALRSFQRRQRRYGGHKI
ncbi:dehydrodolichyl diphosphate synthase 2 isoform X1 [Nicotiana tabacum]|uniref:Dehydrodolichyl diphosphate synthase 2 isoform X1 n=1 Tax=Nicotiana tabacum TaxID=4097 RepID=A0AC58TJ85_TOBAC